MARTEHPCSMCGRTIRPGERYHRSSQVNDGHAYTWRNCAHCEVLSELLWWLDVPDPDYGLGADDVSEWEPETAAHLRLKALWDRGWTRKDGALHPVPRIVRCRVFHPWREIPSWFQWHLDQGADTSHWVRGTWSRPVLAVRFDEEPA
ncbi:hypothetical protein CHO01_25430 [Cellulomonas hominis]|uniref:Uncharacterized protein n=1 Tax=Cellulomonas hominis TaxID=156981 RepID=A0A511FGH6_9CELL|nr:hypothetical protein [Cellulomonas hominis]MBB5472510.1 hypothetical protein [Cellulomonas hominis]NKY05880.1 hypothetical protein [Cellulomonas hominis]GEL47427.1 hypothetical protein CHO01_25430 [Cellulomonas hominis]